MAARTKSSHRILSPQPLLPKAQKLHLVRSRYGTINLHELLGADIAVRLNTAPQNIKQFIAFNHEPWVNHGEELEARLNAWAAKGS